MTLFSLSCDQPNLRSQQSRKCRIQMKNMSGTTDTQNDPSSTAGEFLSKAQVIAWCFAFSSETVLAVVGNLLTINIVAFNKKLRIKKSLYLVVNMAFADLSFAGLCLFPGSSLTVSISKIFYDFSSYLYCVSAGFVYYCCPK